MADKYPIIFLQEHWLFGFETSFLYGIFSNGAYQVKCVDDMDAIPPVQPPRGKAGTCILWHVKLNHCMKNLQDGSDRICVVEMKSSGILSCLINVYMPARGSAESETQFMGALDELHEILEKYSGTHRILLGGDFNASLHRTPPVARDRALRSFMDEHGLCISTSYPVRPTFYHASSTARSQIDYWLVSADGGNADVIATDPNNLNLSDHCEVILTVNMHADDHEGPRPGDTSQRITTENDQQPRGRINWAKADTQL
ncbi:MAG: endonuclease/exonuclease/phosphatase family protein [Sedimenticola sp.]